MSSARLQTLVKFRYCSVHYVTEYVQYALHQTREKLDKHTTEAANSRLNTVQIAWSIALEHGALIVKYCLVAIFYALFIPFLNAHCT